MSLAMTILTPILLTVGFLLLASPTLRREIKEYFDLQSSRRKAK